MVIELLPSTRDNLLRPVLLEREGDGKKKNLSKISSYSAWEMTVYRVYNLSNRNQQGALTEWLVWPAFRQWHIFSESLRPVESGKYSRSTFHEPGAGDPSMNKTDEAPCSRGAPIWESRDLWAPWWFLRRETSLKFHGSWGIWPHGQRVSLKKDDWDLLLCFQFIKWLWKNKRRIFLSNYVI